MAIFDEEPRPRPMVHVIGEDLSALSEDELLERIEALRGEILRLEQSLAAKKATREAASAFFRN